MLPPRAKPDKRTAQAIPSSSAYLINKVAWRDGNSTLKFKVVLLVF